MEKATAENYYPRIVAAEQEVHLLPSCPAHNLPYQPKSVFTEVWCWQIHQRDTTLPLQLRGKAGG